MSVPMPPRPPGLPISTVENSFSTSAYPPSSEPINASKLPLIAGALSMLLSIGILVFSNANSWLESDGKETAVHIVGYLLTPIGVVLCLAWDMVSQRKGMRDLNFFTRPKYTKLLRALTLISFLIAWFHIEPIAKAFAESLVG